LKVDPKDRLIFLTNHSNCPKKQVEKLAEIVLEKYSAEGLNIRCPTELVLTGMNLLTGLVLDIGHQRTVCKTIFEGHGIHEYHSYVAGEEIENYFLNRYSDLYMCSRDYKELNSFVAINYEEEIKKNINYLMIIQFLTISIPLRVYLVLLKALKLKKRVFMRWPMI